MVEGALVVTRLRIADELFGCAMLTALPCPIEKPCQLTIAFWLDCVMVSCVADGCAIATLPAATLPPVGRLCASAAVISNGEGSAVVGSSKSSVGRQKRSVPADFRAGTVLRTFARPTEPDSGTRSSRRALWTGKDLF